MRNGILGLLAYCLTGLSAVRRPQSNAPGDYQEPLPIQNPALKCATAARLFRLRSRIRIRAIRRISRLRCRRIMGRRRCHRVRMAPMACSRRIRRRGIRHRDIRLRTIRRRARGCRFSRCRRRPPISWRRRLPRATKIPRCRWVKTSVLPPMERPRNPTWSVKIAVGSRARVTPSMAPSNISIGM